MNKNVISAVTALALLTVLPIQAANSCSDKQVRLKIPKNKLEVTPPDPKCVSVTAAGTGTFNISITPPGAAAQGAVTVVEKPGVPAIIRGDNSADANTVVVNVELEDPQDEDYGYIVRVEGHGELDPEVRIVTSRMLFLNSRLDQVDALLEEEMGFGRMELNETEEELMELKKLQEQAK